MTLVDCIGLTIGRVSYMSHNPYKPPRDYREHYPDPETDWGGFLLVSIVLFIILWHRPLIDFFTIMFRRLLYN